MDAPADGCSTAPASARASSPAGSTRAEHAAIGLLPLVATCDRWDIGGVSTPLHPDTGSRRSSSTTATRAAPASPSAATSDAQRWLHATLDRSASCPCPHGCPSCVHSPKCGNGNEPLDKAAAVGLLAAILGQAWG